MGVGPALFFLVLNSYRLEIFRFKDLPAIQTFNVVDAVPARDHLRSLVVTGGLHKKRDRDTTHFNDSEELVKGGELFCVTKCDSGENFTIGQGPESSFPVPRSSCPAVILGPL